MKTAEGTSVTDLIHLLLVNASETGSMSVAIQTAATDYLVAGITTDIREVDGRLCLVLDFQ